MTTTYYFEMSGKDAKDHLDSGGTFSLPAEKATVPGMGYEVGRTYHPDVYVAVGENEAGGRMVQGAPSFATLASIMEQFGPLEDWTA